MGTVAILAAVAGAGLAWGQNGGHGTAEAGPRTVAVAEADSGPLTSVQESRAVGIADGSGPHSAAAPSGISPTARERNVHGAPGAETLESGRLPVAKGAPVSPHVMARVDLYDYATDTLLTRDIDLTTQHVVSTARQHGVQPPPTLDEVRQAMTLVLADPRLGDGIRTAYRTQTGRTLTASSQLTLQGMIYRHANGGQPGAPTTACGAHRCVQLFSRIPGGKWIDTSRIVIDLSARHVTVISL